MIDRILIFGDSITWGADDTESLGWANRLRKYLQSESDNSSVYNCGVRGDTTKGLLIRFDIEAGSRKSKDDNLILFAIGINDARTIDGVPQTELAEFKENLEELVKKARSITDRIIFIGLTRVVDSKSGWTDYRGALAYTNKRVNEYDRMIETVAQDNALPYLKMSEVLEDGDMPDDGLHPNSAGHEKMFNKIKGYLESYFKV